MNPPCTLDVFLPKQLSNPPKVPPENHQDPVWETKVRRKRTTAETFTPRPEATPRLKMKVSVVLLTTLFLFCVVNIDVGSACKGAFKGMVKGMAKGVSKQVVSVPKPRGLNDIKLFFFVCLNKRIWQVFFNFSLMFETLENTLMCST
jgi:hypothetical protein